MSQGLYFGTYVIRFVFLLCIDATISDFLSTAQLEKGSRKPFGFSGSSITYISRYVYTALRFLLLCLKLIQYGFLTESDLHGLFFVFAVVCTHDGDLYRLTGTIVLQFLLQRRE